MNIIYTPMPYLPDPTPVMTSGPLTQIGSSQASGISPIQIQLPEPPQTTSLPLATRLATGVGALTAIAMIPAQVMAEVIYESPWQTGEPLPCFTLGYAEVGLGALALASVAIATPLLAGGAITGGRRVFNYFDARTQAKVREVPLPPLKLPIPKTPVATPLPSDRTPVNAPDVNIAYLDGSKKLAPKLRSLFTHAVKKMQREPLTIEHECADSSIVEIIIPREHRNIISQTDHYKDFIVALSYHMNSEFPHLVRGFVIKNEEGSVIYYEPNYRYNLKHPQESQSSTALPTGVIRNMPEIIRHPLIKGFVPGEKVFVRTHNLYEQEATIYGINTNGTLTLRLNNGNLLTNIDPLDILTKRHLANVGNTQNSALSYDPLRRILSLQYQRTNHPKTKQSRLYEALFGSSPEKANMTSDSLEAALYGAKLMGFLQALVQPAITRDFFRTHTIKLPLATRKVRVFANPQDFLLPQPNPNRGLPDARQKGWFDTRRFVRPKKGATGYALLETAFNAWLNKSVWRKRNTEHYLKQALTFLFGSKIEPQHYTKKQSHWENSVTRFIRNFQPGLHFALAATPHAESNTASGFYEITDLNGQKHYLAQGHAVVIIGKGDTVLTPAQTYVTIADPHSNQEPYNIPLTVFLKIFSEIAGTMVEYEKIFQS